MRPVSDAYTGHGMTLTPTTAISTWSHSTCGSENQLESGKGKKLKCGVAQCLQASVLPKNTQDHEERHKHTLLASVVFAGEGAGAAARSVL